MKKENIILLLILTLGFILRIFNLDSDGFWLDETFSSVYASKSVEEIIAYCAKDVHPPLYLLLLHYIGEYFGFTDISLRALSLILGTLSIYGVYLLANSFFNKKVALLAALLFALSPQALFYSQEARSYMLLVTVAIFSFYYMNQFLKETSVKRAIPYILTVTLLYYTHTLSVFVVFAQQLYFLYYFKIHKSLIIKWIVTHGIALLAFAPWAYHLYVQIIAKVDNKGPGSWVKVPSMDSAFTTYLFMNGAMITMYLSIALFLFYIIKFKSYEKSKGLILLLLWFLSVLVIPFVISLFITPIYLPRFTILFIPGFLIFIAYIIINAPKWRWVLMSIYLLSVAFSTYTYHTTLSKSQWREAAQYIKKNMQKDDLILFHSAWIHTGIKHYIEVGDNGRAFNAMHVFYKAKKHKRIWIVKAYDNFSSDKGSIASIENYTKTIMTETFPSKNVALSPLKHIEPIDVTLYEKKDLDGTFSFAFKLKHKIAKKQNIVRLTDANQNNIFLNLLANKRADIIVHGKEFIGMLRTRELALEPNVNYYFTLVWNEKSLKVYINDNYLGEAKLKKALKGEVSNKFNHELAYYGTTLKYKEAFNKELIRQLILKLPYKYK